MNEHDRDRLADAMNRLRPDWSVKQLRTLLVDPRVAGRPMRDLAVALAWVASEPATANPYRVIEAGPWWRAVAIDGQPESPRYDRASTCSTCGQPEDECNRRRAASARWGKAADDHEFLSIAASVAQHAREGLDKHATVAALKELRHVGADR